MAIVIFSLHLISIFVICILICTLVFAYARKMLLTFAIIIINFIVFIISLIFPQEIIGDLAFRPLYLSIEYFPQLYTLVTSMFLHSVFDFFHIIFNTIIFVLIAPNFEKRVGRYRFLGIYLLTGCFAAIFHSVLSPYLPPLDSFNPSIGLIGASGAISGIIGAYAYTYPRDNVFFPIGFFITRIPILYAGIFFIIVQSIYVFIGGDPGIAYLAHIGGFIGGVIVASFLKRKMDNKFVEGVPSDYSPYSNLPQYQINKINFTDMKKLAITKELQDILKKIENENVAQVQNVWLEYFLERITCPKCRKPLHHHDGKIWCEDGHFKATY
jgi:membrane associated rhomboid family serine protease